MSHPPQLRPASHLAAGEGSGDALEDRPVLQPTRDPGATLPDLIEVLLNKGVHLNLDLIISVADIPLIGINLRATIAGIETMLEYGMMRQWDEQTRAWVQKSLTKHLPLASNEEIVAAMAASYRQDDFYRAWRPGRAYLTTRRLIIHRRDPAETLWQAELSEISAVELVQDTSVGGETRTRLKVRLLDETEATISAADPPGLLKLIRAQLHQEEGSTEPAKAQQSGSLMTGPVWFLETLAQGSTWRGGRGTLEEAGDFTWKSPMDSRALIRCRPEDVTSVELEERTNPTDSRLILRVETPHAVFHLATADLQKWQRHFLDWSRASEEVDHGTAG